jgi:Family of unknown function (DUF5343)
VALPTSYLTSTKNLEAILNAIRGAQAPTKFTNAFLEELEFKSSSDRLIIGVLKALGFLDDSGKPTERYFRYLDQTQSDKVMAEGLRQAYEDLFRVNKTAHQLTKPELVNKFKTLGQGQIGAAVLDKMATTFLALTKHADFETPPAVPEQKGQTKGDGQEDGRRDGHERQDGTGQAKGVRLGGLVYNIQIVLPDSRDPAVYDALFQSLRRHLL